MADPVLHIKDSYYFEVPRFLAPSNRESIADFPNVWVSLDPEFQEHEAEELHAGLERIAPDTPEFEKLEHDWHHWTHAAHKHHGKPLDVYLEQNADALAKRYQSFHAKAKGEDRNLSYEGWLKREAPDWTWFASRYKQDEAWTNNWRELKQEAGGEEAIREYKTADTHPWSKEKIDSYNSALHGKIIIPQPFGATLRNLYERESGIAISKFMIIEVVVALLLVVVFSWLAGRIRSGDPPRGKLWNLLEAILVFLRDEVAKPAIGHGSDKYVPLLWTIFLFILGCNLFGLLPWAGSPTAVWAVTFALACVTFFAVIIFGSKQLGVVGFWKNQVPHMDLPFAMAIVMKPVLWVIEVGGLLIKHTVLSIRLLANMLAGHVVLLVVLGLAFSVEAAASATWAGWSFTAVISVIAATLLSTLELFVAFLQAYVFTFLSALFIGAAVHHH